MCLEHTLETQQKYTPTCTHTHTCKHMHIPTETACTCPSVLFIFNRGISLFYLLIQDVIEAPTRDIWGMWGCGEQSHDVGQGQL